MTGRIYSFVGEGVAMHAQNRRKGARHKLLVLASAQNGADAEQVALEIASENGWFHLELSKGAEVTLSLGELQEGYLRDALDSAIQFGGAMVSYEAELPPNG